MSSVLVIFLTRKSLEIIHQVQNVQLKCINGKRPWMQQIEWDLLVLSEYLACNGSATTITSQVLAAMWNISKDHGVFQYNKRVSFGGYGFCMWKSASVNCSRSVVFSGFNKTDRHDITEILLKVALTTGTITLTLTRN
jgi:hypothetical protein